MSKHAWEVKTFQPETVEIGWDAFVHCMKETKGRVELSLKFAGYVIERRRQDTASRAFKFMFLSARRSGFRFATGLNEYNYRGVGIRIVEASAESVGLAVGTPWQVIVDKWQEENGMGVEICNG